MWKRPSQVSSQARWSPELGWPAFPAVSTNTRHIAQSLHPNFLTSPPLGLPPPPFRKCLYERHLPAPASRPAMRGVCAPDSEPDGNRWILFTREGRTWTFLAAVLSTERRGVECMTIEGLAPSSWWYEPHSSAEHSPSLSSSVPCERVRSIRSNRRTCGPGEGFW